MLTAMFFAYDLDRMAAFYGDGFDLVLEDTGSQPGYRSLVGDGVRIALHATPDDVDATVDDPPRPRTTVPVKLLFAVDDVGAAATRLERLGGQIIETGPDAVDVADPEGNIVRVHAR